MIRGPKSIDVVHSAEWREPVPVDYEGLELRYTLLRPGRRVAVLRLEHEALGCPPGLYAVGVDHSLGNDTAILAVLPHVVLIEKNGRLLYIADREMERVWRMTWASPWETFAHRDYDSKVRKARKRKRPKRRR